MLQSNQILWNILISRKKTWTIRPRREAADSKRSESWLQIHDNIRELKFVTVRQYGWTGDTQLLGGQPWPHSRWVKAEGACCTFAQRRNCNWKLLPNQQKQSFRWLQLLHWGQIWTGGEKHFSRNVFNLDTEKEASIWFWARTRASFFPLVIVEHLSFVRFRSRHLQHLLSL